MSILSFEYETGDRIYRIEVTDYDPGSTGVYDRAPEDCFPDEPEGVYFDIYDANGDNVSDKFPPHLKTFWKIYGECLNIIHAAQEIDDEQKSD